MRPTYRLVGAVLVAGVLWAAIGEGAGLAASSVVALAAVIDALGLPRRHAFQFVRGLPPRIVARRPFQIAISVSGRIRRPVLLQVRDEPPDGAPAAPARPVIIRPGVPASVTYEAIIPERGAMAFGRVFWRAEGILIARVAGVPVPMEVLVYPDFVRAPARTPGGSTAGVGRIGRVGDSGQFESLREYRPGDPYRRLNWKATARRGRFLVNTYRAETDQPVLILVDAGRALYGRLNSGPRLDHALAAAYAVAAEAVRYGDQVGLAVYDSRIRAAVPPTAGVSGLRLVARELSRAALTLVESDHVAALSWASQAAGRRSLVIWLTDLAAIAMPDEVIGFTRRLSARHVILQVTVPRTSTAGEPDLWLDGARALLNADRARVAARLKAAGALTAGGSDVSAAVVRSYWTLKERGLV